MISNRQYLKRETQAAHDRAERVWVGPAGFADLHAYRRWLTAMLDLHRDFGRPAERRLARLHDEPAEERRISALCADLGCACDAPRPGDDVSESWAWGAQYVLNGSAIGASILLKSASLQEGWPRAYLREMRSFATSGRLADFFAGLDAAQLNLPLAKAGALAVFEGSFAHA
ncbi:MAG: hypothetical protein OXC60_04675 [Litoreibacter sp.]|nr:hypothetical protein [Litoreibacter sp.]MCY4333951.1 hypothetical protein [Litoreibacter sp.]